jgi:hypothetical protein
MLNLALIPSIQMGTTSAIGDSSCGMYANYVVCSTPVATRRPRRMRIRMLRLR